MSQKNGLLRQVEQGFPSFLLKFLPYLMIPQSFAMPLACSTLKNMTKIWQKWKKSLFQLALNPFLHDTLPKPKTQVLGTQPVTTVDDTGDVHKDLINIGYLDFIAHLI